MEVVQGAVVDCGEDVGHDVDNTPISGPHQTHEPHGTHTRYQMLYHEWINYNNLFFSLLVKFHFFFNIFYMTAGLALLLYTYSRR